MKRISFVMNIPSPYRLHTFKHMYVTCQRRGIDFHVHFMARGHAERPASWLNPKIDFPHTYWRDYGRSFHHFNPGLIWELIRNPPDWIHLGSPFDTFTCIALAFLARKAILCAGSEGNTKTPGQLHGIKGWMKRAVYSRCRYVTVAGQEGVRFVALHQSLTKKKMPEPILLPNLVDETRFRPREYWHQEDIARCRKTMGAVEGERLCLIPARFIWEKGLVPFFKLLTPEMLKGWHITIMGHGPLRQEVESVMRERGVDRFVSIIESIPYDDMPVCYAAADLMLLPSVQDQNPLTVIEALHSGLPLALSDRVGNVDEAVTEGRNGWVLPVTDEGRFKITLEKVFATGKIQLAEMGNRSLKENTLFWNTQKAIDRFLDEVEEKF